MKNFCKTGGGITQLTCHYMKNKIPVICSLTKALFYWHYCRGKKKAPGYGAF